MNEPRQWIATATPARCAYGTNYYSLILTKKIPCDSWHHELYREIAISIQPLVAY